MWNVDGKEGVLCLVTSNHQVQGSDALETAAWRSRFGLMLHFPNTLPEPDVSLKRACSCTKCYATWLIGDLERGPEPRTRDRSRSLRIHRRQGWRLARAKQMWQIVVMNDTDCSTRLVFTILVMFRRWFVGFRWSGVGLLNEWWVTMYLPSGKMIVALISLAFLSEQCDCAFFSRIDLPMYFSSGLIMVYLITNSFSLLLQVWNATYFSHCVKFHALHFWLTLMNWFCSCCFCVSFLWWPQTFEMWFCCFPVRIQNAKCCKAIWAPMMCSPSWWCLDVGSYSFIGLVLVCWMNDGWLCTYRQVRW